MEVYSLFSTTNYMYLYVTMTKVHHSCLKGSLIPNNYYNQKHPEQFTKKKLMSKPCIQHLVSDSLSIHNGDHTKFLKYLPSTGQILKSSKTQTNIQIKFTKTARKSSRFIKKISTLISVQLKRSPQKNPNKGKT